MIVPCFACPASADSLIHYVRTLSFSAASDVIYLGIDDWAFKKDRS